MLKNLQDQYIPQLALEGLKRVSSTKYNFRCPICGDSKKDKRKKRGWLIFNAKFDTYVFNCFNCSHSTNFQSICRLQSPQLYELYKEKEKGENLNNFINPQNYSRKKTDDSIGLETLPDDCIPCKEHQECYDYCIKRKIPANLINRWKYSPQYGLVVPFEFDNNFVYGWQSRRLDKKLFHISLPEENPKIWNWFKIDKSKDVYITESIIDASMLQLMGKQAIAAIGSDIGTKYLEELSKPIFVFDNDETGREKTLKYSTKNTKARFLVWDKRIKQKDLNEIIMSGVKSNKLKKFIDNNIKSSFEVSILSKLGTL